MPVMSGIESTKHIRRFEKERGLEPVALIALTGAANPNTRQEAFSSGSSWNAGGFEEGREGGFCGVDGLKGGVEER
jgi:CheY-like chemotaxis protein